jgi:hypothetical protein
MYTECGDGGRLGGRLGRPNRSDADGSWRWPGAFSRREVADLPAPPEAMFAHAGCPLCRAAGVAEDRHLEWFLRENHYSGPTLERLMSSRYCIRHARLLAGGPHRQLSGTFQWLAQGELERLRRWRPGRRRPLPEGVRTADDPPGCLACAAGRTAAAAAGTELAEVLADPRYRAAYAASDGLCQPHLWQLLREAPEAQALWLAADAQRRLERLLASLDLFFHRLDHRFAHEPRGKEQTAWRRGVARFWMVPGQADEGGEG